MADVETVVTSQSWISRIVGSLVGVLVGVVLVVAAAGVLFWDEGRSVRIASSLSTSVHQVVSVPADAVSAGNEGKLVYTSGQMNTSDLLSDGDFGVAVTAIRFVRKAEMFQWKEQTTAQTQNKVGGGTQTATTYTYATGWSPTVIDSSHFHDPAGHQNPTTMPVDGKSWTADKVTLGAFTLTPEVVAKLTKTEQVEIDNSPGHHVPSGYTVDSGGYFHGANPSTPAVGDTRISFEVVRPDTISLVAKQQGQSLTADTATGESVLLLEYGTVPVDRMFKTAETENTTLTWIVRGGGFVAALIGFVLIFRPLVTVAEIVPLIGTLLEAGTFFMAFLVALSLSLVTIAIAWLFYRPLIGGGLLVAAALSLVLLHRLGVEKRSEKRAGS